MNWPYSYSHESCNNQGVCTVSIRIQEYRYSGAIVNIV